MAVPKLEETQERLLEWLPRGTTIYTILRSRSRSGMQRVIGVVVFVDGEARHPNWLVGTLLGRRVKPDYDGIVCNGAGMDMGFELVYSLAQKLYGDGYALHQQWL